VWPQMPLIEHMREGKRVSLGRILTGGAPDVAAPDAGQVGGERGQDQGRFQHQSQHRNVKRVLKRRGNVAAWTVEVGPAVENVVGTQKNQGRPT